MPLFTGILQSPETFCKLSHCFHTAEIAGSIPASPTLKYADLQAKKYWSVALALNIG
jgi:hypothetical protein